VGLPRCQARAGWTPCEDIKFSDPADVGGSHSEFLRTQFRVVAATIGITYEQLTGDLTGVNYSSNRAGMLEFRRRCESEWKAVSSKASPDPIVQSLD
jgi:capsid protein